MGRKRTQVVCAALGVVVAIACMVALSAQTWAQGTAAVDEHRITLDLRDANIEDALRMIFRDTPYSFTIEPDVTGKVTLSLNEVPFSRALRAILDINSPKLTYRKEAGDLYVITRQAEAAPAAPTTQPTIVEPAAEQTVYWIGPGGRYQLQYLDCRDVATWFGGTIIGGTPQYPFPMGGGGTGGGGGIGGGRGGGGGLGGGGLGGNTGGIGGGYGGGGGGLGGGGFGGGGGGGGFGGGGGGFGGGGGGGGGGRSGGGGGGGRSGGGGGGGGGGRSGGGGGGGGGGGRSGGGGGGSGGRSGGGGGGFGR